MSSLFPIARFQSLTLPSLFATASVSPSGEKVMWPAGVASTRNGVGFARWAHARPQVGTVMRSKSFRKRSFGRLKGGACRLRHEHELARQVAHSEVLLERRARLDVVAAQG
jgi:hypothetical protein